MALDKDPKCTIAVDVVQVLHGWLVGWLWRDDDVLMVEVMIVS